MDLSTLTAILPAHITFGVMAKFIAIIAASVLILGLIFRLILGRRSALNRAICAGIGILCIYVLTIIIYTFSPGNLDRFLGPLPFVSFSGTTLSIMTFGNSPFPALCAEVLSMVILILVYNLIDNLLPDGESTVSWLVLRSLAIVAAMVVHYFLTCLTQEFLPELLVSYGPTILLICLIISLLAGIIGSLLGLLMVVANPFLGFLFHFFFNGKIGKQLSKAMLTTAILLGVTVTLHHFGYSMISISAVALLSYIPLFLVLIGLWWLLERIF